MQYLSVFLVRLELKINTNEMWSSHYLKHITGECIMKKEILPEGIITALVTPFSDGCVDYEALSRLIDMQLYAGIKGIVVCGTTGEAPTLSMDEKKEIISYTVNKVKKRAAVIAGCGSPCTKYAVELAKYSSHAGADGLLAVTPYYNKTNENGLYMYFSEIAQSCELPVILYNVPSRTGVDIPMSVYRRLTDADNIVGVKEASGKLSDIERLIYEFGSRYAVYSGCDSLTAATAVLGGAGVISVASNIVPELMIKFWDECAGCAKEISKLNYKLYPLISALSKDVNPIPIKTALSRCNIISEEFRAPLGETDQKTEKQIIESLSGLGLI